MAAPTLQRVEVCGAQMIIAGVGGETSRLPSAASTRRGLPMRECKSLATAPRRARHGIKRLRDAARGLRLGRETTNDRLHAVAAPVRRSDRLFYRVRRSPGREILGGDPSPAERRITTTAPGSAVARPRIQPEGGRPCRSPHPPEPPGTAPCDC